MSLSSARGTTKIIIKILYLLKRRYLQRVCAAATQLQGEINVLLYLTVKSISLIFLFKLIDYIVYYRVILVS